MDAVLQAGGTVMGGSPARLSGRGCFAIGFKELARRARFCNRYVSSGIFDPFLGPLGNPIAFMVETEPGVRIYHYGDTSVFDMRLIGELYRPTVGLHGHIHESRGATKYGRTPAFNPGSEYGEGVLRGLIVAIRGGEVIGHQFTSG